MWTMRWASRGNWIEAKGMSDGIAELASGSESGPCRADLVAAAGLGDEI